MSDLKEHKIYDELFTLKYILSREKSLKNYTKIIDEIIKLCNSQKMKIKKLEEKDLMNRKMNELAETQLLSYGQGYKDGINKETTACSIVARERENQIFYEVIKQKINKEWVTKIRAKIASIDYSADNTEQRYFKKEVLQELLNDEHIPHID